MSEITITIPLGEYAELKNAQLKLQAFEGAGVDNWEGYDYALELLAEWRLEDDFELTLG